MDGVRLVEYITKSDTVKCVGDIFVIQTVLRFVLSIVQIVLILGHSNVSGRFRSWKIPNNPRCHQCRKKKMMEDFLEDESHPFILP